MTFLVLSTCLLSSNLRTRKMDLFSSYWIYLMVTFLWDTANSLKISNLYVPRGASHDAPIDCLYDLEGEPLYDVKWYKDDMQFFRCMANGSVHEFPVDGVSVYYSSFAAVGSCPVKLTALTGNSGGKYKCEVSLDAPTFRTVSEAKTLRIMETSRRTQEENEINAERIKSSFQNPTNPTNSGMVKQKFVLHIYLLFILMFIGF